MRILVTLSIASIATACATGQAGSRSLITRAEISATGATYAYDTLRELRPGWLRRTVDAPEMRVVVLEGTPPSLRGTPSSPTCTARAYVGEDRVSGDDLRRLLSSSVLEIRLIPASGRRPDGSRCSHDRPAIHVILVDRTSTTGE